MTVLRPLFESILSEFLYLGRLNEAPSRAMTRSGPGSRAGRMPSRMGVFTGGINRQPDNEAVASLLYDLYCAVLIHFVKVCFYFRSWICSARFCKLIQFLLSNNGLSVQPSKVKYLSKTSELLQFFSMVMLVVYLRLTI